MSLSPNTDKADAQRPIAIMLPPDTPPILTAAALAELVCRISGLPVGRRPERTGIRLARCMGIRSVTGPQRHRLFARTDVERVLAEGFGRAPAPARIKEKPHVDRRIGRERNRALLAAAGLA